MTTPLFCVNLNDNEREWSIKMSTSLSPTTQSFQLRQIKPRHIEIMNRLLAGHKQVEIARDLSITEARLSIIINSPLFQLELKKKQLRREERMLEIEDEILTGAKLGAQFHKEVLEAKPGTYTTDNKMKSATVMTSIGAKLLHPGNGGNGGDGGEANKSYEERLREITVRETTRTFKDEDVKDQLEAEEIDMADEVFGEIDDNERELPEPIGDILSDVERKDMSS